MTVGPATSAADMVLVVQVVHAVDRVEDGAIWVIHAARQVAHVILRRAPVKRSWWAHLVPWSTRVGAAILLQALLHIMHTERTLRKRCIATGHRRWAILPHCGDDCKG